MRSIKASGQSDGCGLRRPPFGVHSLASLRFVGATSYD
jgi:hypothetical protein